MIGIYFMGAGPIAVPVLEKLADSPEFRLLGAATQPDRPAGRGRLPTPTPVGAFAAERGLPITKAVSVNTPEFREKLAALKPAMVLVVSFGQILKEELLALPGTKFVNIHASLLPKYRGASPVFCSIRNRDKTTGVAFMEMEKGLDSGPVYEMIEQPLTGRETAGELERELGKLAASHCVRVLPLIAAGKLAPSPQDPAAATVCRKIRKSDGRIDWRRPAEDIEALVRACRPWPGATFAAEIGGGLQTLTVAEARVRKDLSGSPGEVLQCDGRGLVIGCGEGALELCELGAPGKRIMASADFLNGFRGAAWHIAL